ncbi:MAG: molybdenum cofactor guanylyltransferase [Planctomycetaceae bacterium]
MSDGAIVLCGGFSRRMGRDKASLPFGAETLLERTVRVVSEAVDEVVLVAREGQEVPAGLAPVARDPARGLGPLAGIAAGLRALKAERAFVTACDAPFLRAAFVRRLLELARGWEAAVPVVDGFTMTAAAAYASSVAPLAERLVREGRLRPLFLVQSINARLVKPEELHAVDPGLRSLRGCNTPEEYRAALEEAGFA